jgi:hypothetical protein
MRRFDYSAEGLPGNIHFLCSLFLIQTLQVSQSDCFKLING